MAQLRDVCVNLGWADVATYIQSGNVLFDAQGTRAALEQALEGALEETFGFAVPCMIRSAAQWQKLHASNPFPDATAETPNLVMVGVAKSRIPAAAAEQVTERATRGESVAVAGDALWIHYPAGSGRSDITPALLDRAAGSPVTTRNARTVERLLGMLNE